MKRSSVIGAALLGTAIAVASGPGAAQGIDGAEFKEQVTAFLTGMGTIEEAAARAEGDEYAIEEITLNLKVTADEGMILVSAGEEAAVTIVLRRK